MELQWRRDGFVTGTSRAGALLVSRGGIGANRSSPEALVLGQHFWEADTFVCC